MTETLARPEPIVVPAGGGRLVWISDDYGYVKLTGAQSGGKLAVTEIVVPPNGGPPAHRHAREEETFLVLEGEIEFTVGDQTFVAGPGGFLHSRSGVAHRFHNAGERPARMLLTVTPPTNFEAFTAACGVRWTGTERPPAPLLEAAIRSMVERSAEFGIDILPGHVATRTGVLPGPVRTCNVLGDRADVRVASRGNADRFGASIVHSRDGGGPPPHVHGEMHEAFYVLGGEIEVLADGAWTTLGKGGFAYVPAGSTHTYRNRSGREARFAAYHVNGTLDAMFAELDALPVPPGLGAVAEVCGRHDTRFV